MTLGSCLVDAHVHFHPRYDAPTFFEHACENFAQFAQQLNIPHPALGVLMLSECADHHFFQSLITEDSTDLPQPWSIRNTKEDCSVLICRDGEPRLIMIAGGQIITSEKLEVLALGCRRTFPDGMPIAAVVESALACGAITVLPWGFGKWWGKRGQCVRQILDGPHGESIFPGDNAARPIGWPTPAPFRQAVSRQRWLLPGTDPLPFPNETRRIGGYGLALTDAVGLETPAANIKHFLQTTQTQPTVYGSRLSWPHFAQLQLALRRRKHDNKSEPTESSLKNVSS